MKVFLEDVHHDKRGFEALLDFHQKTADCVFDSIEVDMSRTFWFDADMCAMLGALLYRLGDNANSIRLTNIQDKVRVILSKNGFLGHYGHGAVQDSYDTTIPYRRFGLGDGRFFSGYVGEELVGRPELPEMSEGLSRRFRESIFEIFSNAVIHSGSRLGVFSCGQFFPGRKQINFMMADLGIGFRENIRRHTELDLPAADAIEWATQGNNTTKSERDNVPGGLGLKLICEFIDLNGGCVRIVSDAGYWKRKGGQIEKTTFNPCFPGTVVSLEIDTADTGSYILASERVEENIF